MPTFSGVDHVSFSVTDLDRSERFYTDVFDLIRVMDFGTGRILLHRETGFMLAVASHEGAEGLPFTELATGLDHLGLVAESRDELVEWEHKLDELGVTYTPIRDMEFGYHLNFRDPDDIALELRAPNDLARAWFAEARELNIPQAEAEARVSEYVASLADDATDR